MGIRFTCPSGHKLHVKEELAGKRGICPACGAKVLIPVASESSVAIAPSQGIGGGMQPPPVQVATPGSPWVANPMAKPPDVTATPVPAPDPIRNAASQMVPPVSFTADGAAPIAIAPPSPTAKYEAQRARARRQRTTIAIVLLLAVIILAVVLVWVLQSGPAAVQSRRERVAPRDLALNDPSSQAVSRHSTLTIPHL